VRRRTRGTTLVELMVAMSLLAIIAGIAAFTLAGHGDRRREPPPSVSSRIAALRDSAVASGRPVSAELVEGAVPVVVTILPDGRIIADRDLDSARAAARPHAR
jgi:prepilin-type N-terminal cleavage/methylation domain-containing protein